MSNATKATIAQHKKQFASILKEPLPQHVLDEIQCIIDKHKADYDSRDFDYCIEIDDNYDERMAELEAEAEAEDDEFKREDWDFDLLDCDLGELQRGTTEHSERISGKWYEQLTGNDYSVIDLPFDTQFAPPFDSAYGADIYMYSLYWQEIQLEAIGILHEYLNSRAPDAIKAIRKSIDAKGGTYSNEWDEFISNWIDYCHNVFVSLLPSIYFKPDGIDYFGPTPIDYIGDGKLNTHI